MNEHGISKAELKKHNRVCILRAIWESGPISRIDIARKLQITRGAITILTNEMIAQKIITEVGGEFDETAREVHKGRRKVMLDIDYGSFFVMGACIDSENISVGLTTLDGKVLEKANLSIGSDCTADELAAVIRESAGNILEHSGLDMGEIIGIGVGVMPDAPGFQSMCTQDGCHEYRKIEELFSKYFSIPVFADNGIKLLSLVCFSGTERERTVANRVFLFSENDSFRISVICGNMLRSKSPKVSGAVNDICVKPGGEELNGFCRGSAIAELTPEAIGKKTARIYGPETTPELYQLTGGDCSAVTIGQLLDACIKGDSELETLCGEILDLFCLMLNNISVLYSSDRVSLCGSGLEQEHLEQLFSHAELLGIPALAGKISLCPMDRQHKFMCGCINAVINGFYRTGGYVKQDIE